MLKKSLLRRLGELCLSGQESKVHWNLLRNLFVKIIIAIFLQKYILESCILSIKRLLSKLAQALVFRSEWLPFLTCAHGSSLKTLKTQQGSLCLAVPA